jgi:hypothetical protein
MRREDHPHDRLTEIGGAMLETFAAQVGDAAQAGDGSVVRAIVLLSQDTQRGIALSGYVGDDGSVQAVEDLIDHARAILRTLGKDLQVIHVPRGGKGSA